MRAEIARALAQGWTAAAARFDGKPATIISDGVTDGSALDIADVRAVMGGAARAAHGYLWLDPPVTERDQVPGGRFLVFLRPTSTAVTPVRWPVYQYHGAAMWPLDADGRLGCDGERTALPDVRKLATATS